MKRYIRNNSYTMDHGNKNEVMKWLDFAESKIFKFCKTHSDNNFYYEIDDISWGTDCISIPIWRGNMSRPQDRRAIDEFRFCYDEDDVFERSAEEQLEDKLNEFLESLEYRIS